MRHPIVPATAALLSLALAGGASAGESTPGNAFAPVTESASAVPGTPALAPRVPRERMSPVMAELHDALAEQRAKLAALRAELVRARGTSREAELRGALSAAKRETEARLLRIQADHARREGRLETAASLEAAIVSITTPPAARETSARLAPSREAAR